MTDKPYPFPCRVHPSGKACSRMRIPCQDKGVGNEALTRMARLLDSDTQDM